MKLPLVAALLAASALLGACSKNKNIDPPAELTDFTAKVQVQRVWSAGVGGAEPKLRLGLGVAVDGERAFAAGHDGDVVAWTVTGGKRLWRTNTKLPLAGGPGAGGGLVVVGSSFGDVVALDAATGKQRWKTRINSEILSAPAVDGDLVVVRTVDGRISGLEASDGKPRWNAEQQVPRLSLRGAATPIIADDIVACGFDNGRVLALNRRDGTTAWEVTVSPPAGRTELQRLVDIDSAIRAGGDDLYVVTFQGRIARIGRDTGQVWWTREMSSYRGLAVDEDAVYVSTSDGEIVKIGRRTGVEMWRQKVLSHRRLSAPAVLGNQVVVADFEGYLHFLDAETGDLSARIGSGGERVTAPPVVVGDELLVVNDEGKLAAFRIRPPRS
jgi:outer membrane protein assembly factor BamB